MKTKSSTTVKTTTTTTEKIEINGEDVLAALIKAGLINKAALHSEISAYVQVPGGGDWSNVALDIMDYPLHVQVTTVTTTNG